ncbi:unnamed protein product [Protopolystoma xenopodis]|uniref:Uncharacterized protein n=1 Tax=Protopolystoma xenopodis TaxID=117903 RepID=A0A3S5B8S3_9PLAT|nr:unnamed protein product [Protopolystoma xenopodis]
MSSQAEPFPVLHLRLFSALPLPLSLFLTIYFPLPLSLTFSFSISLFPSLSFSHALSNCSAPLQLCLPQPELRRSARALPTPDSHLARRDNLCVLRLPLSLSLSLSYVLSLGTRTTLFVGLFRFQPPWPLGPATGRDDASLQKASSNPNARQMFLRPLLTTPSVGLLISVDCPHLRLFCHRPCLSCSLSFLIRFHLLHLHLCLESHHKPFPTGHNCPPPRTDSYSLPFLA